MGPGQNSVTETVRRAALAEFRLRAEFRESRDWALNSEGTEGL